MITRKQFDVLAFLAEQKNALSQRQIEEKVGHSLGTVNRILKELTEEYYLPVENLLDLIYEHYTEKNPVEKNTVAGKAAKTKERELEECCVG